MEYKPLYSGTQKTSRRIAQSKLRFKTSAIIAKNSLAHRRGEDRHATATQTIDTVSDRNLFSWWD